MPNYLRKKSKDQKWTKIKVVEGIEEGKGVFATDDIERGTFICNYGGHFLNKNYCEKNILPFEEKCDYLVEMKENINGKWVKMYLNHDDTSVKTFGRYLNHSRVHPNVKCRTFAVEDELSTFLDILFVMLRDVKKGEQIVWDYGPNFTGVGRCVKSCWECNN